MVLPIGRSMLETLSTAVLTPQKTSVAHCWEEEMMRLVCCSRLMVRAAGILARQLRVTVHGGVAGVATFSEARLDDAVVTPRSENYGQTKTRIPRQSRGLSLWTPGPCLWGALGSLFLFVLCRFLDGAHYIFWGMLWFLLFCCVFCKKMSSLWPV